MRRRALAKFGGMLAAGAVAAVVAGCQPNSQSATRPTTEAVVGQIPEGILPVHSSAVKPTAAATQAGPGSTVGTVSDPVALNPHLLGLDVYVVSVPAGAVSRNEAFWKRVDETAAVTPDEYRLLDSNGVRVGVADQADWPYLKGILDERPAASQLLSYVSPGAKSVDLDLRKEVTGTETIFYIDQSGRLIGRTYENCFNLWFLSFQPVPRDPNLIRIAMTPLVRSQRKRLEVIKHRLREDEPPTREIAYVAPEYLFDLGVESSVPPGKFLVVAPSTKATGGTVGDAFLVSEGLGERAEKVLLLVPRLVPATVEATMKAK